MRKKNKILLILGFLALVVLAFPEIGQIAFFSIIGIPIAVVYLAIPALFLFLLIPTVISTILPFKGRANFVFTALASIATLLLPAMIFNAQIERKAKSYVLADHNDLILPLKFDTIAVRRKSRWNSSGTPCDGFCLHALLSGVAKKVLVVDTADFNKPLSAQENALEFSLQKLGNCPPVKFVAGHHHLELPTKNSADTVASASGYNSSVVPINEMKRRISNGECLVSQQSNLGQADLVITEGRLISGSRYASGVGFRLITKTITVDRISVHTIIKSDNSFKETYRWTGVQHRPFAYAMIPAPLFGYGLDMNMGWLRMEKRINISNKYYERPDWPRFLVNTLGLDLYLSADDTNQEILAEIKQILKEQRAPTPTEWDLISAYFKRTTNELEKPAFEVAMAMLENPHFPAPPNLYEASKYSAKHQSREEVLQLADTLFTRIENGQSWSDDLGVSYESNLRGLAFALKTLPNYVFDHQFERLEKLSYDPVIQEYASSLMRNMYIFGDRSVPVFFRLIDVGLEGSVRGGRYQQPYLTGLGGLCLVGPKAQSALPHLLELIRKRKLRTKGAYGKLLVNTLVSLKADPEVIWSIYSKQARNRTRQHLDDYIKRWKPDEPSCDY